MPRESPVKCPKCGSTNLDRAWIGPFIGVKKPAKVMGVPVEKIKSVSGVEQYEYTCKDCQNKFVRSGSSA